MEVIIKTVILGAGTKYSVAFEDGMSQKITLTKDTVVEFGYLGDDWGYYYLNGQSIFVARGDDVDDVTPV